MEFWSRPMASLRRVLMALCAGCAALLGLVVLGAQPAGAVPRLGGTQWLLYWQWGGQVQKGPCAMLFNANGTLAGDHDGNCVASTAGHWQLTGSTLDFSLAHSCDSQWTATYDSSNGEFDNGTMNAYGPSCGGNDGTFWLSPAGRIDGITFDGTAAAPKIVITGQRFGTEPTAEPVPTYCSATDDDFVGGGFYLSDVTDGWFAGQPGNCIGLDVTKFTTTKIVYRFGSWYDNPAEPEDSVLTPGDQLTVEVASHSVPAYVDGFQGSGAASNAADADVADTLNSPAIP